MTTPVTVKDENEHLARNLCVAKAYGVKAEMTNIKKHAQRLKRKPIEEKGR